MFDFLERMRRQRCMPSHEDQTLIDSMACVSGDAALRDAVIVKCIDPGLARDTFDLIASDSSQRAALVHDQVVRVLDQASYNVRDVMDREFHQDVPAAFDAYAALIDHESERVGAYGVAAYLSWLQGDDDDTLKAHCDRVLALDPDFKLVSKVVGPAHARGNDPAWQLEARGLGDAVSLGGSGAMDYPSASSRDSRGRGQAL
ncbi:hypothetical protein [Bifidobacterium aemilianum]|nr:hypothetical protein [Bifidobacterium aemilianum]